ncbi:hypothetical protein Rxycam_01797 [Rubrobacter xylanophilus DSM 9941]|uniref:VLRF1 family aeRF1-type release factor n=1 Tax=Rubrobacter xylanophilus TaxID=49319 RepID=UPI001C6409B2|nr:VLRF1 family aeRF1-type release factor [Rubrobacter xylanophilus]QYJ15967.1 hypothetical protein Rxycam_01797 [Rubrobacter xylanophilus DSM 9941]
MARKEEVRAAAESVAGHPGPVLSAYLGVSAERPENQERAYLLRLREAMDDLGVPEDVQRQVRERLEPETHPGGRTLAVFAAEDGLLEIYRLNLDLPEGFRWGEPHTAPLLLALDAYEPYGAAVVDAERFRYFVVSPLESGETARGYREVDLSPQTPGPRGKADHDPMSRRSEANVHRYYNQLGELIREVTFREGVRRLILAGPKERTAELRKNLPEDVRERVVAEEHVDLGAPEGELLERLEAARMEAEHRRQRELLEEIQESGVRGLEPTLKALQEENRVHHLAVLWDLEGEVRWSDADGLAVTDITAEKSPFSGEPTRTKPLLDALLELAASRGARVDLVRDEENARLLREELGGVAGMPRF